MAIPKHLDEKLECVAEQLMQFLGTFSKQAGVPANHLEALQLLLISDLLTQSLKNLARARAALCETDFKKALEDTAKKENISVTQLEMHLVQNSVNEMLSHL